MWFTNILVVLIVGVALVKSSHAQPYTFPDDFVFCDLESPDLSTCLRDKLQNWTTMLGTRGINHPIRFTLEPMVIDFWVLNMNLNFLNSTEYLWNCTFSQFWNSTVISASYNPENYTLVYTSYYPHIIEHGRYQMFGTVSFEDGSVDAIYGNGPYDKHIYGLNLTHKITFVPVLREHGVEYLQVSRYELDSDGFRDTSLQWHNLYNGDTIRGNRTVTRLAHNAMALGGALAKPFTDMTIAMFRLYTENLISSVPRRQLRRHFSRHP
ncbi:unnamed protein product [Phaedon cochleariae]|uniref:Takeout-like protein n=1 Tax=Phaedon cochleariae TaxID=80249 RepID=J7I1D7_PHACE|nr:takeout-like protein [Phaedon cochleariae]CAH1160015.1 unnamed protein product [Phaedon cochleariae]